MTHSKPNAELQSRWQKSGPYKPSKAA
jgi:hypothetical protein